MFNQYEPATSFSEIHVSIHVSRAYINTNITITVPADTIAPHNAIPQAGKAPVMTAKLDVLN